MSTTEEVQQQEQEEVVEAPEQVEPQESGSEPAPEAVEAAKEEAIDWSFKFNDEVKQVPEELRWVNDKQKAEILKEMYQKSEALGFHKEQTASFKQKIQDYEGKVKSWEPIVGQVAQLQELFDKQDHKGVMEVLGYSKEDIFKLAKQFIDEEAMPPEQKQLLEQNRQSMLAQEQFQRQNEYYRTVAEQQLASLTSIQLDSEFGKPDVQAVANVYDQKFGAGKFRDLVLSQGEVLVAQQKRHIPPSELVPMIVSQFAPFVQMTQNQAGAAGQTAQTQASEGSARPQAKVIPNVKGTSTAIGGKSISSIADLRQLRQNL
jgi:hypothetical protein